MWPSPETYKLCQKLAIMYQNKSGSEHASQIFKVCNTLFIVTHDVKLKAEVKEMMPIVKCI
jgi:hypothetical protein